MFLPFVPASASASHKIMSGWEETLEQTMLPGPGAFVKTWEMTKKLLTYPPWYCMVLYSLIWHNLTLVCGLGCQYM